jgi:hypothetical protein
MSALPEALSLTTEDAFVRHGQEIYDRLLRKALEPEHTGRFVAIEPGSGRHFLGDTGTAALVKARAAIPDGTFYLVRIGHPTADTLSGYGGRIR